MLTHIALRRTVTLRLWGRRILTLLGRWTPARFLLAGGTVLIMIGSAGVTGLLASLSTASLANPPSWINWLHLSVGAFAVSLSLTGRTRIQQCVTLFPAVVGSAIGLGGLLVSWHTAAHSPQPSPVDLSDHLAHLCVGAAAFWALRNARTRPCEDLRPVV